MADTARYKPHAIFLGATSVPFEPNSLQLINEKQEDVITANTELNPSLHQTRIKRPGFRFTLLDPSQLTAIQKVPSEVTQVVGSWLAFEQQGGLGTTYHNWTMDQGIVFPTSITASKTEKATLQCTAYASYNVGVAMALSATTQTAAVPTKAFYLISITIGGGGITNVSSVNVSWDYSIQDDGEFEPAYLYYDAFTMSGSATIQDVSEQTLARFEAGAIETVTLLVRDQISGSETVSVALGNCKVFATTSGQDTSIEFTKSGV